MAWSLATIASLSFAAGCDDGDPNDVVAQATATVTVTETVTAKPTATQSEATEPAASPSASAAPADGATFGPWAVPTEPGPSVVASGWGRDEDITYGGIVVYNNGPMLSGLDVAVQAKVAGTVVDSSGDSLGNVPANSFVAIELAFLDLQPGAEFRVVTVEGEEDDFEEFELASGGTTVAAEIPSGRNDFVNVPVELTNHESQRLPDSSKITVLVLDAEGVIIGSGTGYTSVAVPGNGTVSDVVSDVWIPRGAASVIATIDHAYYGE